MCNLSWTQRVVISNPLILPQPELLQPGACERPEQAVCMAVMQDLTPYMPSSKGHMYIVDLQCTYIAILTEHTNVSLKLRLVCFNIGWVLVQVGLLFYLSCTKLICHGIMKFILAALVVCGDLEK